MKRTLSLILALAIALAVPALALADDPDHIVGMWYFAGYTEPIRANLGPALADVQYMIMMMLFEADGTIRIYEVDFTSTGCNPVDYGACGRWTKTNGVYSVAIVGVGEHTAYLNTISGELRVMYVPGVYYNLHEITDCDWFSDLIPEAYIRTRGW